MDETKDEKVWVDTGATLDNCKIFACGDERKLVGPPGTKDYHYRVS